MTKTKSKAGSSAFRKMMEASRYENEAEFDAAHRDVIEKALQRSVREVDEPTTREEVEEIEAYQEQQRKASRRGGSTSTQTFKTPGQLRTAGTKAKVVRALSLLGRKADAQRIHECVPRSPCSSFYCGKCRTRAVNSLETRVKKRVDTRLGGDEGIVQERLRFVTVLHEVVDVDSASVSASVEACRLELNALHRRFPKLWMEGAFEFELIDVDHLASIKSGDGKVKSETVRTLMPRTIPKGLKILVHFHAIMDLVDEDAAVVTRWMKNRWNAHWRQVDVQVTEKGQSLEDKLRKLSSYCFKNRTSFNDTFKTRDFELGKDFTFEQLGKLAGLYQDFLDQGSGTLRALYIALRGA
jgi:hypothetical protein